MTQQEQKIFDASIEVVRRLANGNHDMLEKVTTAKQECSFDIVISMLTDCHITIGNLRSQLTKIKARYCN